ncbi:MAG: class I adenylate-forming enzyme family protein [Prochlorothrix sp.]|nr:class I adenylate-forming enzyme family protein [Prochlorothrix sp.]
MDLFGLASTPSSTLTDGTLTCAYAELGSIFEALHAYLTQQGVRRQDPIIVECDNSVASAVVILGLLHHGYSFLPMPQGQRAGLENAVDLQTLLPGFCPYLLVPDRSQVVASADLVRVDRYVNLQANPVAQAGLDLGDRADRKLYLRTSGSTGTPKVVMHSQARLAANVQACVDRLQLTAADRIALPVPLFHMYGLGAGFLPGIRAGASIDLQQGANLLRYLQREQKFNPNVAFLTPIFCETLLKGRRSDRPYRITVAAGDRVREDTFTPYEARFGCLIKLYGSTEMGALSASSPAEPPETRSQTVGQPMPDVTFCLKETETLTAEDRAKGLGELWCRREAGFEGYLDWQGQPLDLGQWDAAGWFRTKDLGRLWPDGGVEVLGRCDHSVNRDGLLVFFADVERVLESLVGVEAAVVVSKGESQRGKNLTAYCVVSAGYGGTAIDLRQQCFDRLPNRAVPDRVLLVKALPLLANGKIDRQALVRRVDAPDVPQAGSSRQSGASVQRGGERSDSPSP